MSLVPVLPATAPFTAEQRAWLNGYFAGLFSRGPVDPAVAGRRTAPSPAAEELQPLTILFGSQTGTAEGLAKRAAKEAGKRGFAASVLEMAQTDPARLAAEHNLLVIVSTFGEGEPPDNARALHTGLATGATPSLANVRFSVCALGDTNYVQFCKCGQDFDAALEKNGGQRIAPRIDCDLDYEEKFSGWLNTALSALAARPGVTGGDPRPDTLATASAPHDPSAREIAGSTFSRQNPFPALLLTSRTLNGTGSAKQVQHVEFSLENSGLVYEAGDALGVMPHNCPELVADVLRALGCDGEEAVTAPDGSVTSFRRALTERYDLGKPSPEFLTVVAPAVAGHAADLAHHSACAHVIDVLLAAGDPHLAPAEFVRLLRKLPPRLYSIASSPRAHPGQIHLTVGAVRYEHAGRARKGVCSTFLADRATPGETRTGVFVQANKSFRPPASGDTPMVMVGPGTGVAPFRAFLHERRATGARGRNWLFFGDQHGATDFLYATELAELQQTGVLTRLDTAFSRDQPEKIYVQHRMLEHAAELFAWLEAGAHFYVCGDASRMAKDVDAALHTVIERGGTRTAAQAADYVQALKAAKRYARDVY